MPSIFSLFIAATTFAMPLVVIDSGHEPSRQGSRGQCGKTEVQYNDEAVTAIRNRIQGIELQLTREPGSEMDRLDSDLEHLTPLPALENWAKSWILWGRPAKANRLKAEAFLSFHHDSTPDRFIDTDSAACAGKGSFRLNSRFRESGYVAGYGLFIYDDKETNKERFENSLRLAKLIGAEFKKTLGRKYSTFHTDKNDCPNCVLLDAELGVTYKNLAVTRQTKMPAVLVEIGTIVDEEDEKLVNNDTFRASLGEAINRALKAYFKL